MSKPIATTASASVTASRKRKITHLRFVRPTMIHGIGHLRELHAGEDAKPYPGADIPTPEMWWLQEQGLIQVGTRYFSTASSIIESWDCD